MFVVCCSGGNEHKINSNVYIYLYNDVVSMCSFVGYQVLYNVMASVHIRNIAMVHSMKKHSLLLITHVACNVPGQGLANAVDTRQTSVKVNRALILFCSTRQLQLEDDCAVICYACQIQGLPTMLLILTDTDKSLRIEKKF